MAYVWQRWLADAFRAAGLEVIEVEGWENRGRPASTGDFNPQGQNTTHHDAATSSPTNPCPVLKLLIVGRPDLPGPLCQIAVDHLGRVWIIAAGRANHAGRVGKSGVVGMPLGADGNALSIGDEVSTNGTQALPPAQRHAIAVVNAVIRKRHDRGPEWSHRHEDISGTGKWDLGSLTTQQLRDDTVAVETQEDDMPYTEKQLTDIVQKAVAAEVAPLVAAQERTSEQNARIRTRVNASAKALRQKVGAGNAEVRALQAEVDELAALVAELTGGDAS